MDSCLKTFIVFTYTFTILRQFGAIYNALEQAAIRAGSFYGFFLFFIHFPASPSDRAIIDLCCLSATGLLIFVHYYIVVNYFMRQEYRHRHFVMDLVVAFLYFANAEALSRIDIQQSFGWNVGWLTLMMLYGSMVLRMLMTKQNEQTTVLRMSVLNWYVIGAMCATLGWLVGKPRFNAIETMNRVITTGILFLVVGWLMVVRHKGAKRTRDWLLSPWLFALLLVVVIAIGRTVFLEPVAEVIVRYRHRLPMSSIQLGTVVMALIFLPQVVGVDWNAIKQSLQDTRKALAEMRNAFGRGEDPKGAKQ